MLQNKRLPGHQGEAARRLAAQCFHLAGQAFVDHGLTEDARTESSKVDLPGVPTRMLSDVRYGKVHKTVAEGNFVFVQGEGRPPGDQIIEVYDLFRLDGGKIVEHWDVHQALPPRDRWANADGPF